MGSIYQVISIEDDQGIFKLIEATLRPLPVTIHHASTGLEALDMIPHLHPDIIVLDIALPDIQGWDVLHKIKEMSIDQPDVVVLSARVEPGRSNKNFENQVGSVMSKPFIPAELRHTVSELLGLA